LIYLNNVLKPEKTVKKEFQRHVKLTEQHMPSKSAKVNFYWSRSANWYRTIEAPSLSECPEGLFVCTPPEASLEKLRTDNFPWMSFRNMFGMSCGCFFSPLL
jgi:hypothetical protein